jgi:predicted secreted protein
MHEQRGKPIGGLDMNEIVIRQSDQGKTFDVRKGDLILFRLEEPITGHLWEHDVVDGQIIEFLIERQEPGTGIGSSRKEIIFKAKSPGTVKVQLKRRRQWEPEDAAIDYFEVIIHVQRE